jgi:hypothetical protein
MYFLIFSSLPRFYYRTFMFVHDFIHSFGKEIAVLGLINPCIVRMLVFVQNPNI